MKAIRAAISAVQILMASALVVLEYLSGYRAGVMHHLYYQKIHYQAGLYSQENLLYHLCLLAGCLLVSVWLNRKKTPPARLLHSGYVALLCLLFWFAWSSTTVENLVVYAYVLMCLEVAVLLETVWAVLCSLVSRRRQLA